MNRRNAAKALVGSLLVLGGAKGQNPAAVRIGELRQLPEVWADIEFRFANQPCLLVRVPPPKEASPRIFKAGEQVYLTAYSRLCTHQGCTVPLPDQQQNIECGCHGSRFRADGSLQAGPASQPLRAIRLELREGVVWAVGWLEP